MLLDLILGSAIDTWATVGVAVGTIATVVYALFRDVIVLPRRRPKLELRFDRGGNDQVIVGKSGSDAAHVRLRVANGKGKDTADDVVVMVTELRRLDDTDDARGATPVGLPLIWSGTNPPLTVASVHPGSERHIDLVHVARTAASVPLQLDVSPKPTGGQEVLDPGAYEISIEVRARNADAARYVVPILWDGKWSGEAATWDHLRVESPRPTR